MPPIQVFTETPINASKAEGTTPRTAAPGNQAGPPTQPAHTAATTTSSTYQTTSSSTSYQPAQPGVVAPSQPVATALPLAQSSRYQPTPTQPIVESGPPPPQPGAVPVPPSSTTRPSSQLPPPPKAGETLPPQLAHTAPPAPYPSKAGSSTIPAPPHAQQIPGAGPTLLQNLNAPSAADISHPPGYQQNTEAAEFSSHQRAAHSASVAEGQTGLAGSHMFGGDRGFEDEEGIWGTAKKWALSAGESLAAAESEVWKRINKD